VLWTTILWLPSGGCCKSQGKSRGGVCCGRSGGGKNGEVGDNKWQWGLLQRQSKLRLLHLWRQPGVLMAPALSTDVPLIWRWVLQLCADLPLICLSQANAVEWTCRSHVIARERIPPKRNAKIHVKVSCGRTLFMGSEPEHPVHSCWAEVLVVFQQQAETLASRQKTLLR
jgi:hypothetical protein